MQRSLFINMLGPSTNIYLPIDALTGTVFQRRHFNFNVRFEKGLAEKWQNWLRIVLELDMCKKVVENVHLPFLPTTAPGVNTMTVLPTVVTKSKNPVTVFVT